MNRQRTKYMKVLLCIMGLAWISLTLKATQQDQPVISLKKVLSAKQIEMQPLATRFDMTGKRAIVVEVSLSGPNQTVSISSSDFVFRFKTDSKEQEIICIGLYKGYGFWDLASQGPVTDDRNYTRDSNQQLLFLIPTAVTQGFVLLKTNGEAVEVKTILSGK